jgi:superfamily II DNA/RNA helicase
MNLKKINPELQKALLENGLAAANDLQSSAFPMVKSGADCVVVSPNGAGKTTFIALSVIQRLSKPEGESTRALVIVESKEKMIELVDIFERLGKYNGLRAYGTSDKSDIDNDKNLISLGVDVLIGTPIKINNLFAGAGFNLGTVRMFVIDDADLIFKNRQDAIVLRLFESVSKAQFIFTAANVTEKVEIMADKLMNEPLFFEPGDDDEI